MKKTDQRAQNAGPDDHRAETDRPLAAAVESVEVFPSTVFSRPDDDHIKVECAVNDGRQKAQKRMYEGQLQPSFQEYENDKRQQGAEQMHPHSGTGQLRLIAVDRAQESHDRRKGHHDRYAGDILNQHQSITRLSARDLYYPHDQAHNGAEDVRQRREIPHRSAALLPVELFLIIEKSLHHQKNGENPDSQIQNSCSNHDHISLRISEPRSGSGRGTEICITRAM